MVLENVLGSILLLVLRIMFGFKKMVWWVWFYGVGSHEAMVLENVLGSILLLVLRIMFGFKKWFGGFGFMGLGLMRLWF